MDPIFFITYRANSFSAFIASSANLCAKYPNSANDFFVCFPQVS